MQTTNSKPFAPVALVQAPQYDPALIDLAVERLLEENNALKARGAAMEDARFALLAQEYRGKGDVVLFEDGLSPDGLRRLCDGVLHTCGGRCAAPLRLSQESILQNLMAVERRALPQAEVQQLSLFDQVG